MHIDRITDVDLTPVGVSNENFQQLQQGCKMDRIVIAPAMSNLAACLPGKVR